MLAAFLLARLRKEPLYHLGNVIRYTQMIREPPQSLSVLAAVVLLARHYKASLYVPDLSKLGKRRLL